MRLPAFRYVGYAGISGLGGILVLFNLLNVLMFLRLGLFLVGELASWVIVTGPILMCAAAAVVSTSPIWIKGRKRAAAPTWILSASIAVMLVLGLDRVFRYHAQALAGFYCFYCGQIILAFLAIQQARRSEGARNASSGRARGA